MGWFSTRDKSDAEQSLERLQTDEYVPEIYVTLVSSPVDRAPGSPLSCLNEGPPVHVGDRVQLATSFAVQETSIVSITVDGSPTDTLEEDQSGQLVLEGAADLTEVYRTSCLMDPGTPVSDRATAFLVRVDTAEQRGRDAYVVGRARGPVKAGKNVVVAPWVDPDDRFTRLKEVEELADGRVGVLLTHWDASTLEHGDEVEYLAV